MRLEIHPKEDHTSWYPCAVFLTETGNESCGTIYLTRSEIRFLEGTVEVKLVPLHGVRIGTQEVQEELA